MSGADPAFEDAAAVMAYVASRLDFIEQQTELLKKQSAQRRHQIAVNIRGDVSRIRWALTHVQGQEGKP